MEKVERLSRDGLFYAQHVHVGWRIELINGAGYTKALLDASLVSGSPVTLTVAKDTPTEEQYEVLCRVRDRVKAEREREEGSRRQGTSTDDSEPLRGLVHGLPGTGKSKVIFFIRRFFEEALGWKHGNEFLFVAYQNTVAHAMAGETIHTAGGMDIGNVPRMSHTDVDPRFLEAPRLEVALD